MKKQQFKTKILAALLSLSALSMLSNQAFAGVKEAQEFYDNRQYKEALNQLSEPSAAKDPKAQTLLATMYLLGHGLPKNVAKSLELFETAAQNNQSDAQLNLATMYMVGQNVKKDNVEAFKWFTVLVAQKDQDASLLLSFLLPDMTRAQKEEGFDKATSYLTAQNIQFNNASLARAVGIKNKN